MKPTVRDALILGIVLLALLYLASYVPIITLWGYRVHTAGLVWLVVVEIALIIRWIMLRRKGH
jgi:hypothetical protein